MENNQLFYSCTGITSPVALYMKHKTQPLHQLYGLEYQ